MEHPDEHVRIRFELLSVAVIHLFHRVVLFQDDLHPGIDLHTGNLEKEKHCDAEHGTDHPPGAIHTEANDFFHIPPLCSSRIHPGTYRAHAAVTGSDETSPATAHQAYVPEITAQSIIMNHHYSYKSCIIRNLCLSLFHSEKSRLDTLTEPYPTETGDFPVILVFSSQGAHFHCRISISPTAISTKR